MTEGEKRRNDMGEKKRHNDMGRKNATTTWGGKTPQWQGEESHHDKVENHTMPEGNGRPHRVAPTFYGLCGK